MTSKTPEAMRRRTPKATRRELLKLGVGAGQLALLSAVGAPMLLGTQRARAALGSGPKKLLTLYLYGGWQPAQFFCPLAADEITRRIPPKEPWLGEPAFFTPDEVRNIDGSGDAPDADDPSLARMRVVHQWDGESLDAGLPDRRGDTPGYSTSPHGYAWKHYGVFQKTALVHGIDQGTAAHVSGRISSMCGLAGPRFRIPAIHAWVTNALTDAFPERPLGSVAIGSAPQPLPVSLGARMSPTAISSIDSLDFTLSEETDAAWSGLRDRSLGEHVDFRGAPSEMITANRLERYAMMRTRALAGTTNATTDALYERLYDTYGMVSKQLGAGIVDLIDATPGWEHLPYPFYNFGSGTPFGMIVGSAQVSESGGAWNEQLQLSLKLLKSNTCSAVSARLQGAEGFNFDTHQAYTGPRDQSVHGRMVFEAIARLLAEMDATPGEDGGTLLDDTLVLAFSDFARTWPGTGCDHWPFTTTIIAGGGIRGNRMIGNYAFPSVDARNPVGAPIALIDEGGDMVTRPPKSADIVFTALHAMGIEDFFIPGGPGEIVGVRS
jgi:hypothetical protein